MSTHSRSLKRWTGILGSLLGILLSSMIFIIWQDNQAKDTATQDTVAASRIRIHRDGFDEIQLAKNNGRWQFESPCQLLANEQRLTPLLNALKPGAHQYTANEVDLEAAGLITPNAIVYINDTEHRLGNTDLKGERRYVQRGNVVEFAPEWVLSLVNGGVTALATLEIFPEPLSKLSITDDSDAKIETTLPDKLAIWQNISAQQIVTWPLQDMTSTAGYQIDTIDDKGGIRSFSVYNNDTLTAIKPDDAQCAYILSKGSLPHPS
ncbi:MAG: hypothetical protein AB8B87_02950 [Granulosicoccus sp.]